MQVSAQVISGARTATALIAENTTLVLSTGSDLFKFLKGMTPDRVVAPADGPAIAKKIQASDIKP